MTRARVLALLLAALLLGTGCRFLRSATWDDSEVDDSWAEEIEQKRKQDEELRKGIAEQRAKLEAEYLAKNPGAQPPARR